MIQYFDKGQIVKGSDCDIVINPFPCFVDSETVTGLIVDFYTAPGTCIEKQDKDFTISGKNAYVHFEAPQLDSLEDGVLNFSASYDYVTEVKSSVTIDNVEGYINVWVTSSITVERATGYYIKTPVDYMPIDYVTMDEMEEAIESALTSSAITEEISELVASGISPVFLNIPVVSTSASTSASYEKTYEYFEKGYSHLVITKIGTKYGKIINVNKSRRAGNTYYSYWFTTYISGTENGQARRIFAELGKNDDGTYYYTIHEDTSAKGFPLFAYEFELNSLSAGTVSAITDLEYSMSLKQDELISGTNIKTIHGQSILGEGNIDIVGPQGPTGPQGEQGPQGVQGEQGPQGATGAQGEQGPQGEAGPQGATGAQGEQGPQGEPGTEIEPVKLRILSNSTSSSTLDSFEQSYDYFERGLANSIVTYKGGTSDNGYIAMWRKRKDALETYYHYDFVTYVSSTGLVKKINAVLGKNDDNTYYFTLLSEVDVESNPFFVFDGELSGYTTTATTAELSAATSAIAFDLQTLSAYTETISGCTGPQGPVGPQGEAGPQGATGAQGEQGPQGETGPQGATGAQGATGEQGPQGATGPQGEQGPQGETGPQGATGAQGPQGPSGSGLNDAGSGIKPIYISGGTAYDCYRGEDTGWRNYVPMVNIGVLEGPEYYDFHLSGSTNDYDARIRTKNAVSGQCVTIRYQTVPTGMPSAWANEETGAIVTSRNILNIWVGTQAEYDAITTKSNITLYIVQ